MNNIYPMLAHVGSTELFGDDRYLFEQKLDGIRCLVEYDVQKGLQLFSRQRNNITAQFPDVIAQLSATLTGSGAESLILDGEIITRDGKTGDFQDLQTRLQRQVDIADKVITTPCKFVAFDLLAHNGRSKMRDEYIDRHLALVDISRKCTPRLELVRAWRFFSAPEMRDKFRELCSQGCEGLIAKLATSHYEQGTRSRAWLKIKPYLTREVYIGGYTLGTGRLEGKLGAIAVGVRDEMHVQLGNPATLRFVGLVGTGFTDEQRDIVRQFCDMRDSGDVSPFIGLPASADKQIHVFCKPELMCRVSYQELTKDGIFRFPSYEGLSLVENLGFYDPPVSASDQC